MGADKGCSLIKVGLLMLLLGQCITIGGYLRRIDQKLAEISEKLPCACAPAVEIRRYEGPLPEIPPIQLKSPENKLF